MRLVSKPNHIPLGSERNAPGIVSRMEHREHNEGCDDYMYEDGGCG
jgi:hypothetical protein